VTLEQVQAALPRLEQFAEEALRETGVPGLSIAVVYQDEVVYLKGFGVREAGKSERVTENTVFQLASMSKPVGSTVIAALVSDGVVAWDDRIVDLNPEFQMFDPWVTNHVTVRDLYAHRSGLPGDAGNDLERLGYEQDEILRRLRYLEPGGDFRASYAYSNFGMTAGAVAAAKAAGKTWEEVSEEILYRPLGMSSTSSRYEDFAAQENRAHLHILVDGEWTPKLTRDADAQSPAGGASSSARDLAQWVRLQLGDGTFEGEQVVSEDALAQTHQPLIFSGAHPITAKPTFYGLGWQVYYDDAGRLGLVHAGAFSVGARTVVNLIPSEDLGIVVLSNAFPTGVPEAITDTFFDLVHEGEPTRDWLATWNNVYDQMGAEPTDRIAQFAQPPATPSAALPNVGYVGTYTNDYVGGIEVVEVNGVLTLLLGPQQQAFPLRHYDRDVFLYYPVPESPNVPGIANFTVGADQQATQVVIEGFYESTFTRVSATEETP
jgi:CubicO group peptidase (beta-lactamase class C family)